MLSNYLLIALRNLWKHKSFTIINVVGLAVGMAITLLSLLYVTNELSYDRFHLKKDRIQRLIVKVESSVEGTETSSVMTAGVGPSFLQDIAEIEKMLRVSIPREGFFTFDELNYDAQKIVYADSSFFEVFSFKLISGNPKTVLQNPYGIVLTESMVKKIFNDKKDILGKIIRLNNKDNCIITGIVEDPPVNSHLQFDVLISFTSLYEDPQMYLGWNGGWNYSTYFLLYEGADINKVEEQFVKIAEENINKQMSEIGVSWNFFLQPLLKVHLNSNVNWDIETKGSKNRLILFIAVTFVILIIACINFINLTTASALTRMKEVGVRKVSGASKQQIIYQFLTESLLVSFIALLHAIILIEVFYLWVSSQISDRILLQNFELYNKSFFQLALAILFIIIVVGILAGGYPAIFMSNFKPALAVKGKINLNNRTPIVRNLLVVFQFTISIILIICTLVIGTQLDYLLKSNKGFKSENKLIISLTSESSRNNVESLKEAFRSIPGVEHAGASSQIPGMGYTMNGYFPEGHNKPLMFHALDIDYDYLSTMGLEIVKGRNFSKEFGTDNNAYLINQALARQLGWEDAVGKTIRRGDDHKIIGVIKNYNYSTLHDNIEPLIITMNPWRGYSYLTMHTSGLSEDLLLRVEEQWRSVVPYEDFESFTLDSYILDAYGSEKQYMNMLLFCACLTLFIASLGLFGLSAFITRRRYKEIAVRKVFGAGIRGIYMLISSSFLKWVLVSNIIAWPLAYLIMDNYFLVNYAYNNGISWWIFVVALLFSIIISSLVIFFQIIRLRKLNPIEYIQYE